MKLSRLLILAAVLLAAPAGAAEPPREVVVRAAIDGDTLALETGTLLRLAGITTPKASGPAAAALRGLAAAAREALSQLAEGRRLTLAYGGRAQDRHGRLLAHASDMDGRWLQGELLARGLARVMTEPDNHAFAGDMLRLESAARAAGLGLWANQRFRVLAVDEAQRFIDSFQIVEGTIVSATRVRGRGYLNFGPDWRTDFTIALDQRTLKRLAGSTPESLNGRRVRVRGWLKSFNGPMIEATHPEQIELIDP
jgi:endonuclease YncB( thermonuclease family)